MIAPEADRGRGTGIEVLDLRSSAASNERPYPIASDGGDQLDLGFAAPREPAPSMPDQPGESAQVGTARRSTAWLEACVAMSELMERSKVAVLCQIRGVEEFYL